MKKTKISSYIITIIIMSIFLQKKKAIISEILKKY